MILETSLMKSSLVCFLLILLQIFQPVTSNGKGSPDDMKAPPKKTFSLGDKILKIGLSGFRMPGGLDQPDNDRAVRRDISSPAFLGYSPNTETDFRRAIEYKKQREMNNNKKNGQN